MISKVTFIDDQTFRGKKDSIFRTFTDIFRDTVNEKDWHCRIKDGSYIE